MPQYLVVGQDPPDLCPSANANIRKPAAEGGEQMPALAEKMGVKILATYVPMTNHRVYVAVEADDSNAVREFAFQGRLGQWNTIDIYQTSTLEQALTRVQELDTSTESGGSWGRAATHAFCLRPRSCSRGPAALRTLVGMSENLRSFAAAISAAPTSARLAIS
jgi:hypothetical protein